LTFPAWLGALLGDEMASTWERLAPVMPAEAYLGGGTAIAAHLRHRSSRDLDFFVHSSIDFDGLIDRLRDQGPFAVTDRSAGTLNGVFDRTRVQFLQAGLHRPEHRLEPTVVVAGLAVAGLGDLLAMKLNAIAGRAQLRDYFDLMAIEQQGGRSVEEGIALFLARYQPDHPDSAIRPILLGLGYLGDVADDPFLPLDRATISRYWEKRQPEIIANLDRQATQGSN
jgi:hypothetical protein